MVSFESTVELSLIHFTFAQFTFIPWWQDFHFHPISFLLDSTKILQDRGVDLSFDMVKKENFEGEAEMKNVKENCDLRVKSENMRSDTNQTNLQSPSSKLQLGGGRLKFYKGQSSSIYTSDGDDMYTSWRWGFSIQCSCGLCLLVWKMFVKKRELGRREEKRGGHANEAGVGKRARGGTKAFIVPSLLRHTSYQPTLPRIEWPVWALKRGFVRIHPDFQNVFTIKFQTLGFPKKLFMQ